MHMFLSLGAPSAAYLTFFFSRNALHALEIQGNFVKVKRLSESDRHHASKAKEKTQRLSES